MPRSAGGDDLTRVKSGRRVSFELDACLAFTEPVAAVEAAVVIEDVVVDDFAHGRACSTACCPAEQSTDDGSGDKSEGGTHRATN
jgi:hypothetical protein